MGFIRKAINVLTILDQLNIPASQKNTPNGFFMLDADGKAVGPMIPRSGTKAEIDGIPLGLGERARYTDIDGGAVGDGVTNGGFPDFTIPLAANVETASDVFVDVISVDMTGYPVDSIWIVEAFVKIQSGSPGLIDAHNFRLRFLPGSTYASLGGGWNTYTGNHGLNTISYENTEADGGLGGQEIAWLVGQMPLAAGVTAKLQLSQVVTAAGKPMYAIAAATYLRVRRVA